MYRAVTAFVFSGLVLAAPAVSSASETPGGSAGVTIPSVIETMLSAKGQARFRLTAKQHKAVLEAYAARDYRPIWMWDGGLNQKGVRVLGQMSTADDDGLRSADYLPASLDGFSDDARAAARDKAAMARIDLEITRAAITYALHASRGRIEPREVSRQNAIRPERTGPAEALEKLTRTVRPGLYLAGLLPDFPEYHALKAALQEYRARAGGETFERIANGRLIRPGRKDERIRQVRRRLIQLGMYTLKVSEDSLVRSEQFSAAEQVMSSIVYDRLLVTAVKRFQRSRGLKSGGIIGRNTIAALNRDNSEAELNKVLINLERMRWLPQDLGARHVFVNQAGFRMRLINQGKVIHESRVIVGKPEHQTPVFSDEMKYIVFNPYWNVPRSIAVNEMLPRLARNPYYLSQRGYEVFYNDGRRSRRINSGYVDWRRISRRNFRFQIRQRPGRSNALGTMKFMFPNKHSIYLHDTPAKNLFSRTPRAFSHGCVRVQNPGKLAKLLLKLDRGWSAGKIDRMVASGRNQRINLTSRVPVHLKYFTAWPNPDGTISFNEDIYGRDRALTESLGRYNLAMK